MRRTLLMIAAVALLLTQCRKPAVELPTAGPANENMVSMTVTVGHGGKTDINGTTGAIKWSKNDKLYVGDGEKYIGCLTLQGEGGSATGTFTGSVSATANDYTFGFYYLGSGDYTSSLEGDPTSVDISFAEQDIYADANGKLTNASKFHIGYGTATGKVEGGSVILASTDPVTMTSKVAIAYFEFKDGETPYEGYITLSGDHICNSMTVGFNGSFSGTTGTEGNAISLTDTESSQKYVMLVPTGTGEETLNFGGAYEGTTKFYKGIEANKFYCVGAGEPIEVSVTKAHETVNFGTPNLNWSKYNLGVDPEDLDAAADWYGDYYAWGATETWYSAGGQTSSPTWKDGYSDGYSWAHCPFTNGTYSSSNMKVFTKYIPTGKPDYWAGEGGPDNKLVLESSDDAAAAAWGDGWRMPTSAEWQELYAKNTFKWLEAGVTDNETGFKAVAAGYLVVKGKGESIDSEVYMFLPAAGGRNEASFNGAGSSGSYWSSSLYSDDPRSAYSVYIQSGIVDPQVDSRRYAGMPVRPVR